MDDLPHTLEAEYCPPLDPALVSAILSDYDLTNPDHVRAARATLDQLRESATEEEQLGFDASGTGARDEGLFWHGARPESCPDTTTSVSLSRDTDGTSVSNDHCSVDLTSQPEDGSVTPGSSPLAAEVENLDEEAKVLLLEQVLEKRVSRYTVQFTLRKCNGKWHRAMEELLSRVYLEEAEDSEDGSKVQMKSIDAFSEGGVGRRSRKGKSKRNGNKSGDTRRSSSLPVSPVDATSPTVNVWQSSRQDIDFISSKTGIPSTTIGPIYHKNGASLPKTIGGILKSNLSQGSAAIEADPIKAVNAHELGLEFPSIAPDYVAALVSLTYPSTAAAHELAKALTTRPASPQGGIQIVPHYDRPNLPAPDETWNSAVSQKKSKIYADDTVVFPEAMTSAGRASAYAAARSAALAQAYAAHRKAKSNPLMGGAAAYYGQVSRDFYALSRQADAASADQLAAAQSTPFSVDLHGIDVLNGVRIAQENVRQWWEGLGESRFNGRVGVEQRHSGYRIIVGRGTHSEGGRSKLGPAVSKALKNSGWKIESDGAAVVVKGKNRT